MPYHVAIMALAALLSSIVSACGASRPDHVRNRTPYTTFNPAGKWQAVQTVLGDLGPENQPAWMQFSEDQLRKEGRLTFPTQRSFGSKMRYGKAFVDGDKVYALWALDEDSWKTERSVVIWLADRTATGFDAITAGRQLGWETGRGTGIEPFKGRFELKGVNFEETSYDAILTIDRHDDDTYTLGYAFDDGSGSLAGIGFLAADRLMAARYPVTLVKHSVEMRGTHDRHHTTVERYSFAGFVLGAYTRDGESLVGEVIYLPRAGAPVRGREVLQRSVQP